jgi:hypothetical protein
VSQLALSDIGAGDYVDLAVRFAPTQPGQGAGTVRIETNDPSNPTITIPLSATVLYPEIRVSPESAEIPPTVVGCSSGSIVTVTNAGSSDLVFTPSIMGSGYSLGPYNANSDGTVTVAPGASVSIAVNYSPAAVHRRAAGTLTFASNDPFHPVTTVNLCAEAVPVGIRVLVLKPDGSPYAKVDQMTITEVPGAAANLKDLPLMTIDPPQSCKLVRFQLETALPMTNPEGRKGGQYRLFVRVGNRNQTVEFTLGECDFREIILTIP